MNEKRPIEPWQWPDEEWRRLVDRVRAGRRLRPKHWKGGARLAVALSFDSDHETSELREGGRSIGRLAWGQYGNRVGVPRILSLLEKYDIPASFYVPAVTYDLSAEIAKRLGRPGLDVIDTNYSAIFAGLYSKRYEMIPAPTNITKERAAQMLFSEPYMPTGIGFLTKKGGEIGKLEDLKGKAITVNNGSISDKWLTDHEKEYGFTIQRYNKNADAVQAVMIGRAFANAADVPVSRYVAKQTPMAIVAYVESTGRNFGLAFRKEDSGFRAEVEKIMECMKHDGAMAEIYKKWFGVDPEADSSVVKIYPGIGAPDFEGYDSTKHEVACKS